MIEAIKKFSGGYRAVGIRKTAGTEGVGFVCTVVKDGRVLGEAADYADGGCVNIRFNTREEEQALVAHCKARFPQYEYATMDMFFCALVDYEEALKKLKTKAKKALMVSDETKLDENGVAVSYATYSLAPTEENRAKVLAKFPNTKFLNDELEDFPTLTLTTKKTKK